MTTAHWVAVGFYREKESLDIRVPSYGLPTYNRRLQFFEVCGTGVRVKPMSYRGIKRILGESSLERKIHILFAIFFLALIAGAFLWVNSITEDIILRNTRNQAKNLVSDHILRTHLKNPTATVGEQETSSDSNFGLDILYELMASEKSTAYTSALVSLDNDGTRNQLSPMMAKESNEVGVLKRLVEVAKQLQEEQNRLETIRALEPEKFESAWNDYETRMKAQAIAELDEDQEVETDGFFYNRQNYYYYAPVVFKSKSSCLTCHFPTSSDPESEINKMRERLATDEEVNPERYLDVLNAASPVFVRITLDNRAARQAVTRSRAILISVAIVVAAVAAGMLWFIVRYVIVKPLAHLRNVTEEISHGKTSVRAQINTGDEFEELSRSFNRMLRHVEDTQSALQEANDVLDRKVIEQAQLNLKLHEMNQIKSEFMANMSHELRTPLNSIIGFSELLENAKGLDPKQTRFASNIRNSGRLLLDLINDILDLAKLEAGKMEVRLTDFSIQHLISEICEMVRQLANRKNLKLEFTADASWPDLEQDRLKVQQILTNLLSNAIKFTPEGGRINVIARRENRVPINSETAEPAPIPHLVLEVHDTGVGISAADQEIVFEKFRQGPSALGNDALTREVSGTGLGLSIVKELCILLGGTIDLESEVGRGSVFTVSLPWVYQQTQAVDSELKEELQKLTATQRVDLARASLTPVPPDNQDG